MGRAECDSVRVKEALEWANEHLVELFPGANPSLDDLLETARKAVGIENETEFNITELIADLEKEMLEAAENLEFEKAALIRDRIAELKSQPEIGSG